MDGYRGMEKSCNHQPFTQSSNHQISNARNYLQLSRKALECDRLAGSEEVGDDFVVRLGGALGAPLNKEGPEPLTNGGGKHAFEVLEGGPPKIFVLALQAS